MEGVFLGGLATDWRCSSILVTKRKKAKGVVDTQQFFGGDEDKRRRGKKGTRGEDGILLDTRDSYSFLLFSFLSLG